jgi:hypothetical protein
MMIKALDMVGQRWIWPRKDRNRLPSLGILELWALLILQPGIVM